MPVQEQAATMTCSNRASITGVGYELPLREAGITTGVPPIAADCSESNGRLGRTGSCGNCPFRSRHKAASLLRNENAGDVL